MKLTIDYNHITGSIKRMNAVNNGPVFTKNADQNAGNMQAYTDAGIPFARNHDAAFFSRYGGEHTVDITAVFPDFDADPNDPASYDFHYTDEYSETIMAAGTGVFFRLGQKIEHGSKKYGIIPPKDFHKWAVICEHLIAHMNEGWADGHHYGIKYWEIWNEPDLYGKCWMGTPEEFYELYAVTARHLKARFPDLMIGGPAVTSYCEDWLRGFFTRIRDEKIPMDFYSWHRYARTVENVVENAGKHRALMAEYGLDKAESILDEWNYVKGWGGEEWTYSLETEVSMKGAAFIAGVMSGCQKAPVDMLMYYDARPCGMNGMFDSLCRPIKGYYPIKTWGEMLKMGRECASACDIPNIYCTAACDADGSRMAMITYYTDDENASPKTFKAEIAGLASDEIHVYRLDEKHNMEETETVYPDDGCFWLTMEKNSVIVIR